MNKKGFTMVELIIVFAVLAVLAVFVIPSISKYIGTGKGDYNEELLHQLEISGKNYYSENKSKLPNKPYYQKALISSTHVALPTLQSGNYISKEFVDSEGRECSESYVYVVQHGGTTENEYHPCLICEGVNYSKDDAYCHISNWDDKTNPNCNLSGTIKTDESSKVVGKTYYNPVEIKITAEDMAGMAGKSGKIAYILLRAYENGTDKMIDEVILDVSKMTKEEISDINLMKYFVKDENGNMLTAEYRITVLDEGGNQSSCLLDKNDNPDAGPTIKVIIDKEKPSCKIIDVQKSKNEKYIKFDEEKTKDDWSKQETLSVLINQTKEATREHMKNNYRISTYKYDLKGKADDTYYGHVMDEAGNIKDCSLDVKIKMFEDEKPYCILNAESNVYKYVKRDGKTLHTVDCYLYKGEDNKDTDLEKIELKDKSLGDIEPKINSDKNKNKENKIVIDIPFKVNNSGDGWENIILKPGTVKVGDMTNDEVTVQKDDFYVDVTYPGIKWETDQTPQSGGWYKKGLKITATCTDTGSKMKSISISGAGTNVITKRIDESTMTATITNNVRGQNIKYTAVCIDNAGNSSNDASNKSIYTKTFNIKEYSAHSSCGCAQWKSCATSACGCYLGARCAAAGCESGYYYFSKVKKYDTLNTPYLGTMSWPSSPTVCTKVGETFYTYTQEIKSNGDIIWHHKEKSCLYGCNYYYRSYSKCGCAQWNTCRAQACGCQTYNTCWHY